MGDTKQESKSGAIAIEAAVTGAADVRSPLATSWLFDKRGPIVKIGDASFLFLMFVYFYSASWLFNKRGRI